MSAFESAAHIFFSSVLSAAVSQSLLDPSDAAVLLVWEDLHCIRDCGHPAAGKMVRLDFPFAIQHLLLIANLCSQSFAEATSSSAISSEGASRVRTTELSPLQLMPLPQQPDAAIPQSPGLPKEGILSRSLKQSSLAPATSSALTVQEYPADQNAPAPGTAASAPGPGEQLAPSPPGDQEQSFSHDGASSANGPAYPVEISNPDEIPDKNAVRSGESASPG